MEKIYPKKEDYCEIVKTRPETIAFLLNYSKALHIVDYGDVQFENTLN
ncbi:hypothetical protein U1E44_15325 [Arenibacter sp. GZD96]|nr:hypothetical protein [Arenibacter sp. GZD-96]MEA1787472.1 hypothetical protein [Arenibacter sp. GZD-96]